MGFFPTDRAADLRKEVLRAAPLVRFEWLPTTSRYWLGFGTLTADGVPWTGLGDLASISGIEAAIGGTAPEVTLALSGVKAEHLTAALDASTNVTGKMVTVYLQFFDASAQVVGTPYALWAGKMDVMRIRAPDAETRVVEVTAETVFARRASPPWAWLTDRDQRRRYSGDRGLEFVPTMASKNPVWPNF